ncbi:MAG: hypothetical protein R3Y24_07015 [Eubacteriales bacterium]
MPMEQNTTLSNTITSYQMIENNLVGDVQQPAEFYDLINVMMICLGASCKVYNKNVGKIQNKNVV